VALAKAAVPFDSQSDEPLSGTMELAQMCARNEVATELWGMANEYKAKAAELGSAPEIGAACRHHLGQAISRSGYRVHALFAND
jgi:hypothetical protein